MVKKKTSINQNFEALKAQMQAKRKLAENKFEQEKTANITPVTPVVPLKEVKKDEEEEYITLNIIDDEDDDVQVDAKNNISSVIEEVEEIVEEQKIINNQNVASQDNLEKEPISEAVRVITPISKKIEATPDINMNRIVLKKVEKQEAPKRITYYLKPETIKKIDKFSRAAGMGKSEFVQTILDEILNNLEIEK